MRIIKNSEEFFLDLENKQPELYDSFEFLSEYKNTRTLILTRCKRCGLEANKYPRNLIQGNRCQKCYKVAGCPAQRLTHEAFIEQLVRRIPDILDKFVFKNTYISSKHSITVECRSCGSTSNKQPSALLSGKGCKNCTVKSQILSKEEVEGRLISLLPNYIFSEVDYSQNMKQKVVVACDKGHLSSMSLASIFTGVLCRECSNENKRRPDLLIKHLKDFPHVKWIGGEYKTSKDKLLFECKHHGIFSTRPDGMIERNVACPVCSRKNIKHYSVKLAERNRLDFLTIPCNLYLINIHNIGYKVGISVDVKSRINAISKQSGKIVEILKVLPMNMYSSIVNEDLILNTFPRKILQPTFSGYTEVLDAPLDDILNFLESKLI